jgi:hypothetical protein
LNKRGKLCGRTEQVQTDIPFQVRALSWMAPPDENINYECFGYRVARWLILRPKIPIWAYFGGLGMENVGILCGHLV